MSKEYQALTIVKNFLVALNDPAPETRLTSSQIVVDYPDPDKMPYQAMVYIVPEGGSWEVLTTESVLETFSVKLYILAKSSPSHTTMGAVISAVYDHFAAIVNAFNTDPTCGGSFIDTMIESYDFYPAVAGLTTSCGIETTVSLRFERNPLVTPSEDTLPGIYVIPNGD